MPTALYLIRHGATEGDDVKRYKGSIDVPLSEAGIRQITDAAELVRRQLAADAANRSNSYLRDIHSADADRAEPEPRGLAALYTSDLQRARASAAVLGSAFGLEPVVMPELRERHFGIWEGMSFREIREKYPQEFAAWAADPLQHSPVEGETTVAVRDRVIPAIEAVVSRHAGQNIAIVAHGGVIRVALCHYLGTSLRNIFRIEQDFAGINVIEFWGLYPVIRLMNGRRMPH